MFVGCWLVGDFYLVLFGECLVVVGEFVGVWEGSGGLCWSWVVCVVWKCWCLVV